MNSLLFSRAHQMSWRAIRRRYPCGATTSWLADATISSPARPARSARRGTSGRFVLCSSDNSRVSEANLVEKTAWLRVLHALFDEFAVHHHQHLGDRTVECRCFIPFVSAEGRIELDKPAPLVSRPPACPPSSVSAAAGRDKERLIELLGLHLSEVETAKKGSACRFAGSSTCLLVLRVIRLDREYGSLRARSSAIEPFEVANSIAAECLSDSCIEQLRMRRRIVWPHIVDRLGEAIAEKMRPDAIDGRLFEDCG